jgi:hypothetical protein
MVIAREGFITFIHRESLKSCIKDLCEVETLLTYDASNTSDSLATRKRLVHATTARSTVGYNWRNLPQKGEILMLVKEHICVEKN